MCSFSFITSIDQLKFSPQSTKKEGFLNLFRPTGLVQKPPNSRWGEATKKSERTLFEMKKQVTNQALCQFNIDFDSIGVDIPNTDSHIKSQKHVSSFIQYVYAFIWFQQNIVFDTGNDV